MKTSDSDSEPTGSDEPGGARDLSARLRDVAAAERDQASDERDARSDQRDVAAGERDRLGDDRDDAADLRDRRSDERDRAADERDRRAELFETAPGTQLPVEALRSWHDARASAADDRRISADDRLRNLGDRTRNADQRTSAGRDRTVASEDRFASARARSLGGADRADALSDRDASASDRRAADRDALTGAYLRGPGLRELAREAAAARRTGAPLTVVFVDVDRLKQTNDSLGHAAGDARLRQVADGLRSSLRPYDIVLRYGGDEFVCVLPGLDAGGAAARLASLDEVLLATPTGGSITTGVAQLRPGESAAGLVRRADAALYTTRGGQR